MRYACGIGVACAKREPQEQTMTTEHVTCMVALGAEQFVHCMDFMES